MSNQVPSSASSVRIEGIEWARVLGCIAIVAFHFDLPGKQLFLGGLHLFTVVLVALSVRSARRQPFGAFAAARLRTLGVPWLFWCAFYTPVAYLDAHRHGEALAWAHGLVLLVGPKLHLWFLPFAIIACLAVAPLARRVRGQHSWLLWLALLVPATIATALGSGTDLPAPLGQWLSVFPSVVLGLCLASLPDDLNRALAPVAIVLVGLTACCGALAVLGYAAAVVPVLVGGVAAAAAWCVRPRSATRIAAWSSLSLGVYVLHPFMVRATYKLLAPFQWIHFAVVVVLSFAVTWALKRTPVLKRFV